MSDSKLQTWGIYIAIGLVALSCYWLKKSGSAEALQPEAVAFSYEMPRPTSYSADFDISGRPIIRKIQTVGGVPPNPAVPALKTPPNPAATPAQKTADAKNKAEAQKKADLARRAQSSVRIADGRDGSTFSRSADLSNNSAPTGSVGGGGGGYDPNANQAGATTPPANNNNDTVKMSSSQWASLLMAQPTAANGALFVAALKANTIDSASFYQIAKVLLTDTAKDRETLGLSLLQQTPSVNSLTILVDEEAQIQDPTLKTQATSAIAAYAKPAQFYVLAQALYVKDAQVVSTATQLIGTALSSAESTQGQGGSSGSGATTQQFQIFIPGLRQLASSSDPSVASQAQALLSSIQSMSSSSAHA